MPSSCWPYRDVNFPDDIACWHYDFARDISRRPEHAPHGTTPSDCRHPGVGFHFQLVPSVAQGANGPITSKIDAHPCNVWFLVVLPIDQHFIHTHQERGSSVMLSVPRPVACGNQSPQTIRTGVLIASTAAAFLYTKYAVQGVPSRRPLVLSRSPSTPIC